MSDWMICLYVFFAICLAFYLGCVFASCTALNRWRRETEKLHAEMHARSIEREADYKQMHEQVQAYLRGRVMN